MTYDGAVVREQGVTFAIFIVKEPILKSPLEIDKARTVGQQLYPDLPIVLAAQDSHGVFEYQGRPDLVKFLASIDAARIPWKRYTVS